MTGKEAGQQSGASQPYQLPGQQETDTPDGLENSLVSLACLGGPSRTRQNGRSHQER